jgi:hypothetical protein
LIPLCGIAKEFFCLFYANCLVCRFRRERWRERREKTYSIPPLQLLHHQARTRNMDVLLEALANQVLKERYRAL